MKPLDFIVIGGGSAGCVLASRLSENPDVRVLLLEAGRPDHKWDVFIHMPAALSYPIGSKRYDWRYQSEPEPHMGGRRIYHARGKVLGGSSSINGMIYVRGNAADYDRWSQETGLGHWDYAHCLPYFRRAETLLTEGEPLDDEFHGTDGPLVMERGPCSNPLFEAFFAAAEEAGYRRLSDLNGADQEGFGPFDRNVHRGRRMSTARAYLHPALAERNNLEVRCGVFVRRVIFESGRAVGVEIEAKGKQETLRAGEIISCGGAINSPQLLQLSGIGPASLLSEHGIEVEADVPGVGENLQDHLEVYVQHASKKPVSMQPALQWWRKPFIGYQWLFHRSGPGATNHFEAGGFVKSDAEAPYPNIQFHFLPLAIRYDGSVPASRHGYQVHVGPTLSDAKGWLRIQSADPHQHPRMQFNYLSTEQDRREWLASIRIAREIMSQPALRPFDAGEISPGPEVESDEAILDWVAKDAETALHPSCTCRMGTGPTAVVSPTSFEVHGVKGLRVVDASVMPSITNGNIQAPVIMIAERAADMIAGSSRG